MLRTELLQSKKDAVQEIHLGQWMLAALKMCHAC